MRLKPLVHIANFKKNSNFMIETFNTVVKKLPMETFISTTHNVRPTLYCNPKKIFNVSP